MDQIDGVPTNEAEADALLADIESPSAESQGQAAPEPAQPQPAAEEFKFTAGGKEVKATREQLIRWATMGYDAPNRIGALNKEVESWKAKEAALNEIKSKYGEIDEYARQNPQWLQHVQEEYNKRGGVGQSPIVEQLQKQVQELVQFQKTVQQERQVEIERNEDKAYLEEFDSVKKKYPDIDFETPDESGKSLEAKVLEYAMANRIQKFTTAFRDFYHDELMNKSTAKAKEQVVADRQKSAKSGILGVSSTPQKGLKPASSVKSKSYGDLAAEALAEYGVS